MAAHLKAGSRCRGLQGFFDVAICEVSGGAADRAEHVMVMALMAELIAEFAVFKKHAADLIRFDQEAESAIHGSPANAGQGCAEILSGERASLSGSGADDQTAWFGVPVTAAGEVGDDFVDDNRAPGPRMPVSRVFSVGAGHVDTRSHILEGSIGFVKRRPALTRTRFDGVGC